MDMQASEQRIQTLVIATEGRRFSVKLPVETCARKFNELICQAIGLEKIDSTTYKRKQIVSRPPAVHATPAKAPSPVETDSPPEKPAVTITPKVPKGYK